MKSDSVILALTNSLDGEHSESVINRLIDRGAAVVRLDVDRIATGAVRLLFDGRNDNSEVTITTPEAQCLSNSIKSVWYRRPNRFNLEIRDNIQKQFAEEELKTFLEGLYLSLPPQVFWLNHPIALERARKKTIQIQLAQQLGLKVPQTIITNDPEAARNFVSECRPSRVIFKTFSHNLFDYGDRSLVVPTTILTSDHLTKLELIHTTPSIFQEFIEKEYDVRVTIVGSQVFAVRINSQEFEETKVDWRRMESVEKLRHQIIELPSDINEKSREMMAILGLSFAAFDFVVGRKNNDWYFLEINPNGQWFWLEHLTGACISNAIADILILAPKKKEVNDI